MWNWLAQNKEWVFSGAGVTALSSLVWLIWTMYRRVATPETSPNRLPPLPSISSSPVEQSGRATPLTPDARPQLRPNLVCIGTRTTSLGYRQNVLFQSGEDGDYSAIAIIANRPDSVGAAPAYDVTAHIIFRKDGEEVWQTFGAWVGNFTNKADFKPGEQHELVIAMWNDSDGSVNAFGNTRSAPLPNRVRPAMRALEHTHLVHRTLRHDELDIEVTLLGAQGHVLRRFELTYQKLEEGFRVSVV